MISHLALSIVYIFSQIYAKQRMHLSLVGGFAAPTLNGPPQVLLRCFMM
jgi:hypothetical protein